VATLPGGTNTVAEIEDDCTNIYVAPYETGVVTAVSIADGSQTVLNPIAAEDVAIDSTTVYSESPSGGEEAQGLVGSCAKTGCNGGYDIVASNVPYPTDVATDGTNVYWAQGADPNRALMAKPVGGGGAATLAVGNIDGIAGFGGVVVYSAFPNGNPVLMSVPATGGTPTTLYSGGLVGATDGVNAYFVTDSGSVGQVPVGGGPVTILATGQSGFSQLAIDATSVYWGSGPDGTLANGTIVKAPIGGGTLTTLATGQASPIGIAVDTAYVYWTNWGDNTLRRLPLVP
jgi:hypothetical protein